MRTYRRVVAGRRSGPEVLELVEEPLPEPALGEARTRVLAAGVGFPDLLMREGTYPGGPDPPFTPGCDLVGEVDAVGPGVSMVRPGDTVAALTYYGKVLGSYAEVACLPAEKLVSVPAGVDPVEAVCLVLNYTTVYQMLIRPARVAPGERVLVHGAAGGVGTAALQLGRLYDLEFYGTCSARDSEVVARLGATAIDYRNEDVVEPCVRCREAGSTSSSTASAAWFRSAPTASCGAADARCCSATAQRWSAGAAAFASWPSSMRAEPWPCSRTSSRTVGG